MEAAVAKENRLGRGVMTVGVMSGNGGGGGGVSMGVVQCGWTSILRI